MSVYVVEGWPSDSYYGRIICYHGNDSAIVINPKLWRGDFSEGFVIYEYNNSEEPWQRKLEYNPRNYNQCTIDIYDFDKALKGSKLAIDIGWIEKDREQYEKILKLIRNWVTFKDQQKG